MIDQEYLRVTEIFHSIQGESTWAGLPCTFVRLTGCPLRCAWCDTEYSFHGGEKLSLEEILQQVEDFGCPLVEITGWRAPHPPERLPPGNRTPGSRLHGSGRDLGSRVDVAPLDPRAHKIMDLKCPGSGEESKNLWSNLDHLTPEDEVKFVLKDRADYDWACGVIRDRGLDDRVGDGTLTALLFSPVWGELDLLNSGPMDLEEGLPVRVQTPTPQAHLGSEHSRGLGAKWPTLLPLPASNLRMSPRHSTSNPKGDPSHATIRPTGPDRPRFQRDLQHRLLARRARAPE